ncbi:amidohydrolase [Laceyella putida]|uniref:5-methylthioadenosine/S-adenosylhomocysteine deaminase n=2 Tax=Laceyella putida TaxID=110101 RepID=A0ABW2RF79_9BACL
MKKAFTHCRIFTLDEQGTEYENGCIIVNDDTIEYIGEHHDAFVQACDEQIDWTGKWVMPGLVNSHVHIVMNILRGSAEDLSLHRWLNEKIWPLESKFTTEIAEVSALAAMIEMIKSGTTTFNDMYNPIGFDCLHLYETIKQVGLKGFFSYSLFSSTGSDRAEADTLAKARETAKHIQRDGSLISTMIAPHSPYACSTSLLRKSAELAAELGLRLHIHVSETEREVELIRSQYGLTPVQYLRELGFFQAPTIFAHGVVLDERDRDILLETETTIAHNPVSNLKLGSGIADITALTRLGVNVAIATDSVASNNNLDMFEELRIAALLQKGVRKNPELIPVDEILRMATHNGANGLGLSQTGMLKQGYAADFITIHPADKIHLTPFTHALSHLVYSASGKDVQDSVVNGKFVMRDKQLLTLDEEHISWELNRLFDHLQ